MPFNFKRFLSAVVFSFNVAAIFTNCWQWFFPQIYPRLLMTISKEPSDSHCRTAVCPQRVVIAVETRTGHLLKTSNQHFQQIVTVIVMMNSLFRYLPPPSFLPSPSPLPLLSSIELGKLLLPTVANMDV